MRERPIGDLVVGLKQLGADVDCFLGTDCPPVRINGIGGLPGGKVSLMTLHAMRFCKNISVLFRKHYYQDLYGAMQPHNKFISD